MNEQNKHYQQLTQEPRYQISALHKTGMTVRAIALEVGVHFSTVSRELSINSTAHGRKLLKNLIKGMKKPTESFKKPSVLAGLQKR